MSEELTCASFTLSDADLPKEDDTRLDPAMGIVFGRIVDGLRGAGFNMSKPRPTSNPGGIGCGVACGKHGSFHIMMLRKRLRGTIRFDLLSWYSPRFASRLFGRVGNDPAPEDAQRWMELCDAVFVQIELLRPLSARRLTDAQLSELDD